MRRFAILISMLALASEASANGVSGKITKAGALPVWPCKINIVNRQTGQPVILNNDTTLTNGTYSLTLPDGRYDLTFVPKAGSHLFNGTALDQRVTGNIITLNLVLPSGQIVSGKIIDINGVGVATTDIRFKTPAGLIPTHVQNNGTNPDGTFATMVDPNIWTVEIIPANAVHKAPRQIVNVNLTAADTSLGNFVVQPGIVYTCSVTDGSLFPITNANIEARTMPGRTRMFTPLNNTTGSGVATIVLPLGNYEVSAFPPPGTPPTFATSSQYNLSPSADVTLPNFALPPARMLSAHVVDASSTPVFNANLDVDTPVLPHLRIETPNGFTDALGNFNVGVPSGTYRITVSPAVATRLIPVRLENVVVGNLGLNMGTLTCKTGRWLNVTVVAEGTGVPIAGANIDVFNVHTKVKLPTIDDVTLANGFTRIVIDTSFYNISIAPPSASYDTAHVIGVFHTLNDTAITVLMPRKGVLGVGGPATNGLRLAAPWPNPAHAGMNFAFAGTGAGELEILDVTGRRVATPWHGELHGEQTARWAGGDEQGHGVPNGIYFARLRVGKSSSVRRVVIAH